MLADSFGRVATDLRVSLTDRCNLRCAYCMPPEGLDWLPSPELLTDDEVGRLVPGAGELPRGREGRVPRGGAPVRPRRGGLCGRPRGEPPSPRIRPTNTAIRAAPPTGRTRGGGAPAEAFLVDGGPARVGVIASVTRPFCGTCDRVRLTADGQVRNCLFARTESDLRGPLRAGASDAELAEAWRRAVAVKLPGHGINDPSFLPPDRPMPATGG